METWKDIKGYENIYQVSTCGRVKRLKGKYSKNERILSPVSDKDGYIMYKLYANGVNKKMYAHRLVASTFIDNPNNFPQVHHKDWNRCNNCIHNLEWCSIDFNSKHKIFSNSHLPIIQYNINGDCIKEYNSAKEASLGTDIICNRILLCAEGVIEQAGGYIWKYK